MDHLISNPGVSICVAHCNSSNELYFAKKISFEALLVNDIAIFVGVNNTIRIKKINLTIKNSIHINIIIIISYNSRQSYHIITLYLVNNVKSPFGSYIVINIEEPLTVIVVTGIKVPLPSYISTDGAPSLYDAHIIFELFKYKYVLVLDH